MNRLTEKESARAQRLGQTLLPLWRRIGMEFTRRGGRFGLPSNAAFTLLHLHIHPEDAEPSVLANSICLPRQTMTFVLDQLEREGMMRRMPHPSDRRRRILQVTPRGRKLAERLFEDVVHFESEGIQAIPSRDLPAVRKHLEQYADALSRKNQRDWGAKHS